VKIKKYLKNPKDTIKFLKDKKNFIVQGGSITHSFPILNEYRDQSGTASGHYFHQDLLVASKIFMNQPRRHIDVGSRIDGFVAHVASFREIEILDIRPMDIEAHPNISYLQANLMNPMVSLPLVDSVSCLHAIEHFGLGRYGDPIDPLGYQKRFLNLSKMVDKFGTLYISFPISDTNQVHFNAHRVFSPLDIFSWPGFNLFELKQFDYVDDEGKLHRNIDINTSELNLKYGCGIYTLMKIS